jgi:hypothetical protein
VRTGLDTLVAVASADLARSHTVEGERLARRRYNPERPLETWPRRRFPLLAGIVLALGWSTASSAQSGQPAPTNMAVRVTEARKANAALMAQYSGTSRTEVIDQGQVKDLRLDAVTCGPGGQLQHTVMTDQSAPLPFGFLRRRIAEHERQKVEEYLTGLRGLLEQNTLPTAGKVQDFMSRATATGPTRPACSR